jgi:hypothetical protein
VENSAARDLATQLFEIHTKMKDIILETQDRQKDNADKSRKVYPMINIGDKIWLLCCNSRLIAHVINLTFNVLDPS